MEKDRLLRFELGVIAAFACGALLKLARPVFVPFAMGLLLAYAFSPALDQLVRFKVPRTPALILVLVLAVVILYSIGGVVWNSGKSFASELPSYSEMTKSLAASIDSLVQNERLKKDLTDLVTGFNVEKAAKLIISALGPFVSFVSELLLVMVFMVFILAGRGRLVRKTAAAFPSERAVFVSETMRRVDRDIQRYLAVKTLSNIIIGGVTALGLTVFGLPFALLFGVFAMLANYIPTLGTIFAVALPALFAAFMKGGVLQAALLAAVLAAAAVAVKRLLERKLMGGVFEISLLLMLFSLFFWGWLWGIAGLFLAVPMMAVAKIVFANIPALSPLDRLMGK